MQDHPDPVGDDLPEDERPDGEQPGSDAELPFPGALGVDPDYPDPGCEHDWRNLHFLDDDEGLVCSRCGRAWAVDDGDARDAVLTLWSSTRRAVEDLSLRQERITRILEELTGTARCHWCNRWDDNADAFVTVNRRRVCPEHLGQLLAEVTPIDESDLVAVRLWLADRLGRHPEDVYTIWLAEKSVVECPELVDGELSIERIGSRSIELPAAWADRLGTTQTTGVNTASAAVARLLELPAPISRAGRAFLLGALARALWAGDLDMSVDAETLTGLLLEAAPSGNRDRATIVLDLYREEMQVDGTVTGEMADDLVEALIGRAASEFAGLVVSGAPEKAPGDPDPR